MTPTAALIVAAIVAALTALGIYLLTLGDQND